MKISVMQGRLVPRENNKYQSSPSNWKEEFDIAENINLDGIEWVFDEAMNVLLTNTNNLKQFLTDSKVKVYSVCADFFMKYPLHSLDFDKNQKAKMYLQSLIKACDKLNIRYIVLPCVDESSIKTEQEKEKFIKTWNIYISPFLEHYNVNIALESDFNPKDLYNFIKEIDDKYLTINYDTGNSASLGYNVEEEINTYGQYISVVHIKDRIYKGKSVFYGLGDTKIKTALAMLKQINFDNIMTLQLFRDDSLMTFKSQYGRFKKDFERIFNNGRE